MSVKSIPKVVVIGASAGGLDPILKLVENLPTQTNMGFVIITHVLRGTKSLLSEIVAKATKMPVTEVKKDTLLRANHIYVLPADKFMEINAGTLHLVPRPHKPSNDAINYFLLSLAKSQIPGSIGIILSGNGSDGAVGLKKLKEDAGGVTIAQNPNSASAQSMPLNAIQIDHVDYILSPENIAREIASMSKLDDKNSKNHMRVYWPKYSETSQIPSSESKP